MKNFEYSRFVQVLKWNVMTNKKTLFTHLLALVAGFFVVQLFYIFVLSLMRNPSRSSIELSMAICASITGLVFCYYASGILGNARTKEERATVLMLPASNAEKYWARLAYVLVAIPLLVIAALYVATFLRMLLQLLLGHQTIILGLGLLAKDSPVEFFDLLVSHLFSVSFFVLGGVCFRKHPFIWTCVSIALFFIFVPALLIFMVKTLGIEGIFHFNVPDGVGYVLLIGFTVFNIWISYRRFCRLEVVQHKWFNV